ncbi:class I SAM-dependent methyltransferase [Granulicella arctica]|uniref:class I SAM-dependent methyltransferase n=1 Tax=Granulicella arctica TaxID=940613 RepID=UPI0021DFBFDA|nr:class I SAM-dependent methyltransferase [Granulicella arctica]
MRIFGTGLPLLQRIRRKIARMRQGRLETFPLYSPFVRGKRGLEIGGPSGSFEKASFCPVYEEIACLDNCDFSQSTVWAEHSESFRFHENKAPGNTLFCDGSALVEVQNATYDVLLSAHNLEHFANPVKALREWQRVLKPSGALVLVLPNYKMTFDHLRMPTKVDHMMEDFEKNTGEEDLTHLPEILDKHDLAMDPPSGTKQEFQKRSESNYLNRCLHHHVFDEHNSRELLSRVGFDVLAVELAAPFHICLLARMK